MPLESAIGIDFDIAAPVVIIGAGACGLCAALAAAEAGVDVLVLEKSDVPSGTTGMSTGLIPAASTTAQRAAGVMDDTIEIFVDDLVKKTKGDTDIAMLRHIVRETTRTVDWLIHDLVLPIGLVKEVTLPGHSRLRFHGTPGCSGSELLAMLIEAAVAKGVDIVTGANVETLFADPDGTVRGVRFRRPDGAAEIVGCGALVLASSGFAGNPEQVRRHIPEIAAALPHTHTGNVGDALVWGEALGAAIADLSGYQGHASVALGHGVLIQWITIKQGGIQVNIAGERFSDESLGYSEQAVNVLAQPGEFVWHIYDERIHRLMEQFADYRDAMSVGAMRRADDLAELADATAMPLPRLTDTIGSARALATGQGHDPFGRDFTSSPPLEPPYYAVKVTAALFHTQGGLVVDEEARVLRRDGGRFPNLFAGGGAARGVSGPTASGYVGGNGLMTATTLGRLAGTAAARLVCDTIDRQ
jgi:fumarate reductase flavoprotein subunit